MRPSAKMPLAAMALPSISLVLTSNLPDISTRPLVTNCDNQAPFTASQLNAEQDGADQHATQTLEAPKKKRQWLYVLRRSRDSRAPSMNTASFFSNAVRRLIPTRS
ncbi:hypothetical protein BJ912DRAFT_935279 [Pholiota molesta]|nr:hypothetical protein BJ912DRAFT_935279 [Pholiota molesta]